MALVRIFCLGSLNDKIDELDCELCAWRSIAKQACDGLVNFASFTFEQALVLELLTRQPGQSDWFVNVRYGHRDAIFAIAIRSHSR